MTLLIDLMLSEDATEVNLPSFGGAIGLFSTPTFKLFGHHGNSRSVGTYIHDGRIAGTGLSWTLLLFRVT